MIRIPVVVAWAGLFVVCALLAGSPLRAVVAKRVSGNLVLWDQARGFDSIVANADVFSEISPFWFRVLPDGRIVPYTTVSGASYEIRRSSHFSARAAFWSFPRSPTSSTGSGMERWSARSLRTRSCAPPTSTLW